MVSSNNAVEYESDKENYDDSVEQNGEEDEYTDPVNYI